MPPDCGPVEAGTPRRSLEIAATPPQPDAGFAAIEHGRNPATGAASGERSAGRWPPLEA